MCCFSRPVRRVSATNIFSRIGANGKQVVVYSMTLFDAAEDLAMILPIPVVPKSAEDAVQFVDFSGYADFFKDLRLGFPPEQTFGSSKSGARSAPDSLALEVQKVGSFDASFVPTVADFSRLDERFRLPTGVWEELPQYADYGFVVFKLRAGDAKVHPMAFAFPSRDRSQVVFPTVHIHDGEVHQRATFDHTLYIQEPSAEVRMNWRESPALASRFIDIDKTKGTVRPEHHVYQHFLAGKLENKDFAFGAEVADGGDKNEAA